MPDSVKILRRRGIPDPPFDIQKVLINQYLMEKEICAKIRKLNRHDPLRRKLFTEVYSIGHSAEEKYAESGFILPNVLYKRQLGSSVNKLFSTKGRMLELGCGRGHLIMAMTELGWTCKGVDIDIDHALSDVKDKIQQADILNYKDNHLYDLIVIDQVLEHIPQEDCLYFLKNIYAMTKRNGYLVSCTPNRLNGPHDISRWFVPLGAEAQGTHFNEITLNETLNLMKKAGFTNFKTLSFNLPIKITSKINFLPIWSKRQILLSLFFEEIYPGIPRLLKPVKTFPFFVPNTIAAQKLNL